MEKLCANCGGYHVDHLEMLRLAGGKLCWCARCGCKRKLRAMLATSDGVRALAEVRGPQVESIMRALMSRD